MRNILKIGLVIVASIVFVGCSSVAPKISPADLNVRSHDVLRGSDATVKLQGFVVGVSIPGRSKSAILESIEAVRDAINRFAPQWQVETEMMQDDLWEQVKCGSVSSDGSSFSIALKRERLGESNLADVEMNYRVMDPDCNVLISGSQIFESFTSFKGMSEDAYKREGYHYGQLLTPLILDSMGEGVRVASRKKEVELAEEKTRLLLEKIAQEKAQLEKERLAQKEKEAHLKALKNRQLCPMKELNWFYVKGECENDVPQGAGEVVHLDGILKFKGTVENGIRTQGMIIANGIELFDGRIKNGKPDGHGICFHENEPEDCKFYRGKRVDAIYKQRIAFKAQQRALDEKMANMQALQKEQLTEMKAQLESAARTNAAPVVNTSGTTNGSNPVGDVIMDKVADKALDMLFDQLF